MSNFKALRSHLAVLGLLCAVAQSHGQGTFTYVGFEDYPELPPGSAVFVQQYYESGMWFRPLGTVGPGNGFVRTGSSPASECPDNGSAYLQASMGDSLVFSFVNNSVFNLVSVDLAEYSTVFPYPATVRFVGYRQDGSTVTTDLVTDGIIDGTGPLADFQTFNFGPEFSGLTRVEIPNSGWSLDNLVVLVPEPASGALLAVGAALFTVRRFFTRRK
jgi:hypothetical protein